MFKLKVSTVKSMMNFIRDNCGSYDDQIEVEYTDSDETLTISVIGDKKEIKLSSSEGYFDENNKKTNRYFDKTAKAMENFDDEFEIDNISDDLIIVFNDYDIDC